MLLTYIYNTILMSAAVVIHYELLHLLSTVIPKLEVQHRLRVIIGVFGTLVGHIIEIWMFGIAYFLMINYGDFGSLQGNFDGSLLDHVYFSFTTYTSLGIGDIEPIGDIRFLAGLEALTGLALITWSASFMFIEMRKFWE
ncbi:MAG: ion channel [Gammaproteobacteria bacterium]|jgi:hypothetical protein